MMRAEIKNFRGIASAEIALAPIALVAAPNASGKSSIAQAVAAVLTGEAVPMPGIKKTEAGMLVRSGTGGAEVALTSDSGTVRIKYPTAKVKSEGTPPSATAIACGLVSVLDMDQKKASATLLDYLQALPTRQDVLDAAAGIGLTEEQAAKLAQTIEDRGWDGAHAHAKETGAKLKGQWEAITGDRYGPAKAERYIPDNWASDLESASEEGLQSAVATARDMLESAIASAALSQDELDRLRAVVATREETERTLAEYRARAEEADAELKAAQEAKAALPGIPAQQKTTPCPCCGAELVIRGSTLHVPEEGISVDEVQRRQAALNDADKRIGEALQARNKANARVATLQGELESIAAAEKKLAEQPKESADNDVDICRQAVRDSEARLSAWQKKTRADKIHASIEKNQQVVKILASDGLRLDKLRDAIRIFNHDLASICAAAQWSTVELTDDLSVSYGGRPWVLMSESERFRARVTLQVAMARRDGSAAVIIDAADILDRDGRNGLVKMLTGEGIPALICMTISKKEDVPNIGTRGIGASYWIDNGTAVQL